MESEYVIADRCAELAGKIGQEAVRRAASEAETINGETECIKSERARSLERTQKKHDAQVQKVESDYEGQKKSACKQLGDREKQLRSKQENMLRSIAAGLAVLTLIATIGSIAPVWMGILSFFHIIGPTGAISSGVRSMFVPVFEICVLLWIIFGGFSFIFINSKFFGIPERISEKEHRQKINEYDRKRQSSLESIREELEKMTASVEEQYKAKMAEIESRKRRVTGDLRKVDARLQEEAAVLRASVEEAAGLATADWKSELIQDWKPDASPEISASIGMATIGTDDVVEQTLGIHFEYQLPALVPLGKYGVILFDSSCPSEQAAGTIQAMALRLLLTAPAGKLRYIVADPVSAGQNAADLLHYGDENPDLIAGKVWTQVSQIEQQMALLSEHMENVVQVYLRNVYETILQYNDEAGEIAEPFRALTLFDYPRNCSAEGLDRLAGLLRNGHRCGVYTLIQQSQTENLPYGVANPLEQAERFARVSWKDGFSWSVDGYEGWSLSLDSAPPSEIATKLFKRAAHFAKQAENVVVPLDDILQRMENRRREAAAERAELGGNVEQIEADLANAATTTQDILQIPLGPSGAKKVQYLTFGTDVAHHALSVGRTGSGKTNMLHVLITAAAKIYPPDELRLYLVDLKGGVGFKRYAESALPHAEVIAIESDREFALSVLERIDKEQSTRERLFRAAGVEDLSAYREARPEESMPRILLLIDEFQELFTEISGGSANELDPKVLMERIARQGRSFGIHMVLVTQSLAGSGGLPAATLNQIAVRIALPCSEEDGRTIMTDDNAAARSLRRPGEAIYNGEAGRIEANNPFQVARLDDERHEGLLAEISEDFAHHRLSDTVVFEGNAAARLDKCRPLLQTWASSGDNLGRRETNMAWLGDPISIAEPVAATFKRQSGRNLAVVTRDPAAGIGMLTASLLALLAKHAEGEANFYVVDRSSEEAVGQNYLFNLTTVLERTVNYIPHRRIAEPLSDLAGQIGEAVREDEVLTPTFLFLFGAHLIRDLRDDDADFDDEPGPADSMNTILRDGPDAGVHTVVWCDSATSFTRSFARAARREFGMRVAGRMSRDDSINFIDSPAASQLIKDHRAVYNDEERPGANIVFRPYRPVDLSWAHSLRAS